MLLVVVVDGMQCTVLSYSLYEQFGRSDYLSVDLYTRKKVICVMMAQCMWDKIAACVLHIVGGLLPVFGCE